MAVVWNPAKAEANLRVHGISFAEAATVLTDDYALTRDQVLRVNFQGSKFSDVELQSIAAFFHPLDGVRDWNRMYGPAGFLQYQFVVPPQAVGEFRAIIHDIQRSGHYSFLNVFKLFGPGNRAPLSYPMQGWNGVNTHGRIIPGLYYYVVVIGDTNKSKKGTLLLIL